MIDMPAAPFRVGDTTFLGQNRTRFDRWSSSGRTGAQANLRSR